MLYPTLFIEALTYYSFIFIGELFAIHLPKDVIKDNLRQLL